MPKIIIADDDAGIRTVVSTFLRRCGYDIVSVGSCRELMELVKDGIGDLVITDVLMPDGSGLDVIPKIKAMKPHLRIIVISAQNTALTALEAAQKGAFEYLPKPFDLDEMAAVVNRALKLPFSNKTKEDAKKEANKLDIPIVGRSNVMQGIYRTLAKLMNNDLTVMISGESGTGKELVARALHNFGHRRSGPFIAVNMAAIPKTLIESEMFGHEKGAYTGAVSRTAGQFERAEGGTLFLDEIGDMPLEVQTRLLRVLQEGEYTTIGGRVVKESNVRIIAATNRNLKEMVENNQFREDLYYRLNVVPINLPPLRERKEDIPELSEKFLIEAAKDGLPRKKISEKAMMRMFAYDWYGNVRELENFIKRMTVLCNDEEIAEEDVVSYLGVAVVDNSGEIKDARNTTKAVSISKEGLGDAVDIHIRKFVAMLDNDFSVGNLYDTVVKEVERPLITAVLEYTSGNQIKAADVLGLNRNTLRKKIKELGITVIKTVKKD